MNEAWAGARPLQAPQAETTLRFELVSFGKIRLVTTASYLVKGIIPREGLVVVWGPPKCGKSFWVFDLVMHVALGWEYRGRRTTKGAVVYVACEGERGLGARVEAFRSQHLTEDAAGIPFHLVTSRLDLIGERDRLVSDIKSQLPDGPCAAVVIDTLNRSIAGSESLDEDMGAYVKAADIVREAFACAVIVIHHCGVDGSRPRGHTSLTGAADAQLAIKREASGLITATVEWMKDGAEGDATLSRLQVVEVGQDQDGEPITSCIIVPADDEEPPDARGRIKGATKIALDLLRKAIDEVGETAPASNSIPRTKKVVRSDVWREYAYAGSISETDTPDSKRKAFNRAVTKLQEAGRIGVWTDFVWLTD